MELGLSLSSPCMFVPLWFGLWVVRRCVCTGQGGRRALGPQRGLSELSCEMDEVCTAGYKIKEDNFEPICLSFPFLAEDRGAVALWLSLPLPLPH